MSAVWAFVPFHLWRGELRAQGLLLRRPLVTTAQTAFFLLLFFVVALLVRDALAGGGPLPALNIAVVTLSLGMLMAANVTLLGERTGTLPWQLQRWAASLPLGATQVARIIVLFSILRSALLTLSLLAAVAIGALTAAHSLTRVVVILSSAVLLPLLPVAVGLQWARRRGASVSIAFTIVPIGVTVTALSVPLPPTSGWVETAVRFIALPGFLIAGRASLGEAVVFLAAWTGLALVLMRPAALSLRDTLVGRGLGSSIWRLSRIRADLNPNRLALDIAVHRVGPTDLLEILFLGAVSCSVVALQSFARGSAFGALAMAAALSAAAATATIAGYVHMAATVRTDATTEEWLRTLPLSARALSVARHAVCSAGALLAVIPVMLLAIVKTGWPPDQGALPLALWMGMSAVALTGWFAVYLSKQGWRRKFAGYALFGWYSIRALSGAAIFAVWSKPILVAGLFVVDLGIALIGQWRGALAASREPGR
jgi:hypothetical protein